MAVVLKLRIHTIQRHLRCYTLSPQLRALSASRPGPIQSSGLQGFEDQQIVIQWVRDNIRSK